MRVTLVPSAPPEQPQLFSSYVINGVVAIDAGCLDRVGSLEAMTALKHIFLTHSHLDHLASLPPFLDAVYDGSGDCVTVYGSASVLECLRRDVFNNRLYPDFIQLSLTQPPFLKLRELVPGQTVSVEGLTITPVDVHHVVPALGFIVSNDQSTVVFSGDTGPTEALWREASRRANLRAVFMECSFPSSMEWLAELAQHLTPSRFVFERSKIPSNARIIVVHLHSRYRQVIHQELESLGLPGVEIGESGRTYAL